MSKNPITDCVIPPGVAYGQSPKLIRDLLVRMLKQVQHDKSITIEFSNYAMLIS